MSVEEKSVFQVLNDVDVSRYTEKKESGSQKLTYLSWSNALAEMLKRYPDMQYHVRLFGEKQLPYVYDPATGYMVFTEVTVNGTTKEMWLPVMDANNRAMKAEPYTITFKNGREIRVEAATSTAINKTIMRCLVKNFAAFGLGLYIYNGDDLPEATSAMNEAEALRLEEEAKALVAAISEIAALGSKLIAAGHTKETMYAIVSRHNHGIANPNEIASMEVANAVKSEFESMLGANKE